MKMPALQENIKVMVRMKPPGSNYVTRDYFDQKALFCGGKKFAFDHIFQPQCPDLEVFEKVCYSLIENAISGYNSTVFVYGQTGTGKTYTMSGGNGKKGVMQKTFELLKEKLRDSEDIENSSLKMSYYEIYNEKVRDLMTNSEKKVRESV